MVTVAEEQQLQEQYQCSVLRVNNRATTPSRDAVVKAIAPILNTIVALIP
jgi:hypothetical protein